MRHLLEIQRSVNEGHNYQSEAKAKFIKSQMNVWISVNETGHLMFEEDWDMTSVPFLFVSSSSSSSSFFFFFFFFFFFDAGYIILMSLIVTGLKGREFCDVFSLCHRVHDHDVTDRDGSQRT